MLPFIVIIIAVILNRGESKSILKDWSYDQCLPYFKAGETSDRGENLWRGASGNLGVSKGSFDNPLFDAFEEAGPQSGQGYSEDLNGYKPEGIARLDATKKNGRRLCGFNVCHYYMEDEVSLPNE